VGPYQSERGNGRGDYSGNGDAWNYFTHDMARSRIYRWGEEAEDPDDMHTVLVEVLEQAEAYVAGNTVLLRRGDGPWVVDRSMPT